MDIERLTLQPYDLISEVGFLHQYSVTDTYPLHTHDFYELFFVNKGNAIHNINGENQVLTSGSFVLIRPDDIHKYDFFNHFDFELISVGFPVKTFEKACYMLDIDKSRLNTPILSPHVVLEGYTLSDIKRKLFHISTKEVELERKIYFLSILPHLLYRFITESNKEQSNTLLPIWLLKLIELMTIKENIVSGLPRLLELSNISHEHLTREFRRHLNITPTEFINTKRMGYAIELLLSNDYEILEVCFMCGYNNLSHFYHIFKKQYGCTPKQYLENSRKAE